MKVMLSAAELFAIYFKKSDWKGTFLPQVLSSVKFTWQRFQHSCRLHVLLSILPCLWNLYILKVRMSDSFTSRALPTWQVFVRDQLEASNTITLPPPRDTQSWPGKHTCTLYQLFPNALSNTQVPVFTLLRQEKCLCQPTCLVGKIFEFRTILRLHNGQFLPWLLHKHTVGSREGGDSWRVIWM